MTTISKEAYNFVVRSTEWNRCEPFYRLADAIAFCRKLGLPYSIATR
jgi:hypothetical protein